MAVAVRRPDEEQIPALLRTTAAAFGEHLDDEHVERLAPVIDPQRAWIATDGPRIVGTAGAFCLRLTVPGGATVPLGGLTWVGVLPTHRRRGVLTRLTEAHLDEVRERDEVASGLLASETTIYGRFGYGVATRRAELAVDATPATFHHPPERGDLRLTDLDAALDALGALHDRVGRDRPGQVDRTERLWTGWREHLAEDVDDPARNWFATLHHDAAGRPDGAAVWRLGERAWEAGRPSGTVEVADLLAADPAVRLALWRHVLDLDLTTRVEARCVPLDDPLWWALTDPRSCRTGIVDHLWLRLVDVPAALGARRYAADGRLDLAVDGAGTVTLRVEDGRGACEPTDGEADLHVPLAALSSLWLGTVPASTLAATGRLAGDPGAVRRADALFAADTVPYCGTFF